MLRCPDCESENYHVYPGYGADCEDCGFAKDAKGHTLGDDETKE